MKKLCSTILALALLAGCKTKNVPDSTKESQKLSIKKDKDQDGLKNSRDKCPEIAGPFENKGCPWPDLDNDGVPDKDDSCKNITGPVENNGCPWPETDGDGVIDKDDACPTVAGPAENNGCPWPDTDGDGILDKDDACPTVPGLPEYNGCPKPKRMVAEEISMDYSPRSSSERSKSSSLAAKKASSSSVAKSSHVLERSVDKLVEESSSLPEAGKLTAGEVNDFSKWDYWQDIAVPTLSEYKNIWKFFPDKRVSVQLVNENKKPIIGKPIRLQNEKGEIIWEAISDNKGNVELWINPLIDEKSLPEKYFIADDRGNVLTDRVTLFQQGQNVISTNEACIKKRKLELAFVVDATGSMSDEIQYLQAELLDVLKKVENTLDKSTEIRYGSVFYRDHGDQYVTRKFDFSENAESLIGFIKEQSASGGGDTPEAVVEALQLSIDDLKWSAENSTKIMFLILDAPPHLSDQNIKILYDKIKIAAKKGVTIIPLAASDIDKQTEYLMRTFALLTNGTYIFLTNHSGIGNNHIEPTTTAYEVEKLNDLLFRLILQRSTIPSCETDSNNEYINKKLEAELENTLKPQIKIFPNPTTGLLNIQSNKVIDEMFLYDFSGKILMRKDKLSFGTNKIDITVYPQSVYLMRCRYGKQWDTFKIIKK